MLHRKFHPEAQFDLEDIWEYISRDSLEAADRVISEIETVIGKAAALPAIGHARPDMTSQPILFLTLHSYLIAYAFDAQILLVIAVLHGKRNPDTIAELLRTRQ